MFYLICKIIFYHMWMLDTCVLFRAYTEFKKLVRELCWGSFKGRE